MKNYFFLICLLFSLFACNKKLDNNNPGQNTNTSEIPKLLNRVPGLQHGEEWDKVQNFYGKYCNELRNNPNGHEAKLRLAECFIQEARVTGEHPYYYPAALKMVNQVLDTNTTDKNITFTALCHKASILLSLHQFAEAKETAQKAIQINPYNAYIYGCLTDAHVELGEYEEAVAACDKMVGIRPDLRSYSRVSYLREIHGDHKGAMEAMDMAVKAGYPGQEQTEWARLQLGMLQQKYGKKSDAEKQFATCLALRKDYPFALAAQADLAIAQENYEGALALLDKAIENIPEVGFFIQKAMVYQKTGKKAEFQELCSEIEIMMQEDMAAGHNMNLEAAKFQLELLNNPQQALQLALEEQKARPKNKEVKALLEDIQAKLQTNS